MDTLVIKCTRAIETSGRARLVVAGGVGANKVLRERLSTIADEKGYRVYYPRPEFCTDNRSEEHTSELQSLVKLVCRLLGEKKQHSTSCITEGT